MEQKSVLVTGGGGFIGSHLCCKLAKRGYKVYALNRSLISKNPQFNQLVEKGVIEHLAGDIVTYDYSRLSRVDYVYHVAGKVSVWGKLAEFMEVNYNGTERLLEYCKRVRPSCFCFFSSACVYGYTGYVNLKENAPKRPFKNPYPISKLKTEELVKSVCTFNNLNFVIIRPGNVYGEYDYTSSHEIYTRVRGEKMAICARGKYKSCFVYVGNLVDAVITASENPQAHNTDYNISDGYDETLNQYLSAVAEAFKVRPKFFNVPAFFAKAGACFIEFFYKL